MAIGSDREAVRMMSMPFPIRMIEMIGWAIFLIALWLIWFWAVKRWVFPKAKTETDLLVEAFNRLSLLKSQSPKGS